MAKHWNASDTYEYTDFNRIESTTKEFVEKFRRSMCLYRDIHTVTDRNIRSIFVVEDINRIEKNLQYADYIGEFKKRDWVEGSAFDANDANRWERMADLLYKAIHGVQVIFCGTHRCGTWPIRAILGVKAKRTAIYKLNPLLKTFEVTQCGTLPEPSTIGRTLKKENVYSLKAISAYYHTELCGTLPENSVIALCLSKENKVHVEGAMARFKGELAGDIICGTFPEIAEIGRAFAKENTVNIKGASATYKEDICGTIPEYSVIALVMKKNNVAFAKEEDSTFIVELTGEYPTGTFPDLAVIGKALEEETRMNTKGKTAAFEEDVCGTIPEYSVIGIVAEENSLVDERDANKEFEVPIAGTNPQKIIGYKVNKIIRSDATSVKKGYKVKPAGVKYCGEEAKNGGKEHR